MVSFRVNGRKTTDEDLLVLIPVEYKPMFEGHNFPDMHTLSMALMHANCAAEARYYGRLFKVEEYENDLLNCMGQ